MKFLSGFIFAFVLLLVCGFLYLRYGHPPVAADDAPFPMEARIVSIPLNARIDRELATPPFAVNEGALQAGPLIYQKDCAFCHGSPGQDSLYGKAMYPAAPALWHKHGNSSVVGVSDDPAGETFWKVKNGIRLTGMPSYQHMLSENEMWDVTLLLKNADQKLSVSVLSVLQPPAAASQPIPTQLLPNPLPLIPALSSPQVH